MSRQASDSLDDFGPIHLSKPPTRRVVTPLRIGLMSVGATIGGALLGLAAGALDPLPDEAVAVAVGLVLFALCAAPFVVDRRPACWTWVVLVLFFIGYGTPGFVAAVGDAREAARRSQCVGNLTFLAYALRNYHEFHGELPPAYTTDASGRPLLSWRVLLLPYMESNGLYERFNFEEAWDSEHNRALVPLMPNVYRCPSDETPDSYRTRYQVITGPGTAFDGQPRRLDDVTDGLERTFLFVESATPAVWTQPVDVSFQSKRGDGGLLAAIASAHEGFNAALFNGGARTFRWTVPPGMLRALATRAGDETVDVDRMRFKPR